MEDEEGREVPGMEKKPKRRKLEEPNTTLTFKRNINSLRCSTPIPETYFNTNSKKRKYEDIAEGGVLGGINESPPSKSSHR